MKYQQKWSNKAAAVMVAWMVGAAVPWAVLSAPIPAMAAGTGTTAASSAATLTQNESSLLEAFRWIRDYNIGQVTSDQLLVSAIQGMVDSLNDPWTTYFTAGEYNQFINVINESYSGVGMQLAADDRGTVISKVFLGQPAATAGLQPDDLLVQVDGTSVLKMAPDQVGNMLRGREGTAVTVVVERAGKQLTYTLLRQPIRLPSLQTNMIGDTGYIRILSFTDTLNGEFDQALQSLQSQGAKSLVIDLRGNSGGFLQSAVHIADRFLTDGMILRMHGAQGDEVLNADAEAVNLPLAILIDGNSASSSEALAGSLHAAKKAILVGTPSFGKGVLQQGFPLANGSVLKLTVGQFFFRDGTSPQHVGVIPDVRVQLPELQLQAALERLHGSKGTAIVYNTAKESIMVNNKDIAGPTPVVKGGHTYLPLRFMVEALGQTVRWNAADNTVDFTVAGRKMAVSLNQGTVTVDGAPLALKDSVYLAKGTSYLSVRAWQQIFGESAVTGKDGIWTVLVP